MIDAKLAPALFIIRVSLAAFLGVWASLKFIRPEWMVNVFRNTYGLDFVTQDYAVAVGGFQMLLAFLFLIGFKRTIVYGLAVLVHGTGVVASVPELLLNFMSFPQNLLWTAVPTLGALIALFLLRDYDAWTVDGIQRRRK